MWKQILALRTTHRPKILPPLASTLSLPPHQNSASLIVTSTPNAMAPKKSQRAADSINAKLALTIKVRREGAVGPMRPPLTPTNLQSGKVTLGYKSTLKTLRSGKAKLIIIAGNTPPLKKSELECGSNRSKRHGATRADSSARLQHARQNSSPPLFRQQREPLFLSTSARSSALRCLPGEGALKALDGTRILSRALRSSLPSRRAVEGYPG